MKPQFLTNAVSALGRAVAFVKTNPGTWAAETTTMLGGVLIGLGGWEAYAGALTCDQALGLVTAGAALLYPQSAVKQAATTAIVTEVLRAVGTAKENPTEDTEKKT